VSRRKGSKQVGEILTVAQAQGWFIRQGKRAGHIQAMSPDRRTIITVSSTPSDKRAVENIRADFKRAGVTF